MKKEMIAILFIITLLVGIIIGASIFSQTKTINKIQIENKTEYICSSNGQKVEATSQCPDDKVSSVVLFELSMDALGANKFQTSGSGWLDNAQCANAIKTKGYSGFNYCYISNVQILTGSDPNPLKMKNGGYSGNIILFGGEVFRVSCICSNKPQFVTNAELNQGNLGLL